MSVAAYPSPDTSLTIPLSISNGGTGATTAANARTNLGLGTMATQNANAVAITGGTLSASTIQGSIRGAFGTGLNASYTLTVDGLPLWTKDLIVNNLSDLQGNVHIGGHIGIGAAVNGAIYTFIAFNRGAGEHGLGIQCTGADTGQAHIDFFNTAGMFVGTISCTGTTTAYNTSSDQRLKYAVQSLPDALTTLAALNPVQFRWKSDSSYGEGFLAHELQQVIPLAVTGEPGALNDDGSIRPQQTDHAKLVPWLVRGIQELLTSLEDARDRIAQLEQLYASGN